MAFYIRNIDMGYEKGDILPYKNPKKEREYQREWYHKNYKEKAKQRYQLKKEQIRLYRQRHSKEMKERDQRSNFKKKLKTLQIVAQDQKPQCVYCGCNEIDFLEINHKNGGGRKDCRSKSHYVFYSKIRKGERDISDLEVTCRVCNALHYLTRKKPDSAMRFKVIWN